MNKKIGNDRSILLYFLFFNHYYALQLPDFLNLFIKSTI